MDNKKTINRDDYYRNVCFSILFSSEHDSLAAKSELGEETAFSYTAHVVESSSISMAENLGYDERKTEALARIRGICYPPYGTAGMAYIKELAARDDIVFSEGELNLAIAQACLAVTDEIVTDDLRMAIFQLYDSDVPDCESKIVTMMYDLHRDYEMLVKAGMPDQVRYYQLANDASDESKKQGKIVQSSRAIALMRQYCRPQEYCRLQEYCKPQESRTSESMSPPSFALPEDAKRQIFLYRSCRYSSPPSFALPEDAKHVIDRLWQHFRNDGATDLELVRRVVISAEHVLV
ncbi:MAG: hypothetical protein LBN22_07040 [Clostridiales Family XIII bacterium]|jgi:hypothetical protein|nr:hypothetical protein [Clostridiales Family XIII bacterium]